jgi:hypothetical protein
MSDVGKYLPISNSRLLAFDYETTGLTGTDKIVGVSFADATHEGGVYFSFKECSEDVQSETLHRIAERPSIAHNAQFEQFMTYNRLGYHANVKYDTQCLLNQIEGDWAAVKGNRSLKNLQVELLGWEDRGDVELDKWLIDNQYVNARGKVLKGEMWRAPDSILGKYCNLDAHSTWELYQQVFAPVLERFPELDVYHSRDFMNLIRLVDLGRRGGLTIDRKKLMEYKVDVEYRMKKLMDTFYADSPATEHIRKYNEQVVMDHYDKMPEKYTKAGKPSKRWDAWYEKFVFLKEENHFNPNSKDQLAWLFYDCLFETSIVERSKGPAGFYVERFVQVEDVGLVACTPSGKRSVDKKILPKLGKAGEILAEYNKLNKELGYLKTMLERSEGGTHHTQLRVSGTKTDRCAGTGGLNIQQLPKSKEYLECLIPSNGYDFIQMDVNALEPVVLAELSECPSYMSLYGPNRPPNDVYLFIASKIPHFSKEILDAGYNPEEPTAEGIAAAKKQCKTTRTICKVIHLAAGYGAGAAKIHETLTSLGVQVTVSEVAAIRNMYWEVFEGVVKYRERLTSEWKANRGYFLDGLGTPVTVEASFEKDILNRCIQRTGHMILVKYLYHLTQLQPAAKPVVVDFHDETIWQCKHGDTEETLNTFNTAWDLTNEELGGIIPLYGTPEKHTSFAGFKCEE